MGGLGRVGVEGKEPENAELEAELGFQVEEAQSGPGTTVQGPKVAGALEPVNAAGWCGTEVSGSQEGRRGAGERRLAPGERKLTSPGSLRWGRGAWFSPSCCCWFSPRGGGQMS